MKGRYTQQELLLLSNFVYIPASLSDKPVAQIIDAYRDDTGGFTEESVLEAARGGGMSCADVRTVFTEIDRRIGEDPGFGEISASRRLEEGDVRAVCYTDPKDRDPVVVFRGTGGTEEAWTDNFEGAFREETHIQQIADDFVRYECGIYPEMVVTGHSKGGNLAQYVTVRQHDRVLECVSYDGQGFGDGFIAGNESDIGIAAPKITSISAYNDFVNILLTSIAGTCLFVSNDPSAAGAHSSVTLLTENEFDAEGNFTSLRSQGAVAKGLAHLTDVMCDLLEPSSLKDKETLSAIAGSAISLALTTPAEKVKEDCIAPTLGMVTAKIAEKIACAAVPAWEERKLDSHSVSIDTGGCVRAAEVITDRSGNIGRISLGIDTVRQNMAYTISARLCAEHVLENTRENLGTIKGDMEQLSDLIAAAALRMQAAEEEAAALML